MHNYSSVKQHIFLNIHLNAPVCKQIPSNSDQVVLRNNDFKFSGKYYNQPKGTASKTKWAPPYKRLVSGYKEETKLFSIKLPKVYSYEESELMKDVFKRFMDDGFLIEPPHINFDNLMLFLSNLDKSVKYTIQKVKVLAIVMEIETKYWMF